MDMFFADKNPSYEADFNTIEFLSVDITILEKMVQLKFSEKVIGVFDSGNSNVQVFFVKSRISGTSGMFTKSTKKNTFMKEYRKLALGEILNSSNQDTP